MRLVVRAEASAEIGTGHLMRCLALAQTWMDSGHALDVVTGCANPALLARLGREGLRVHSMTPHEEMDVLRSLGSAETPTACVLDGYHFGPEYQRTIRTIFHPTMVIDDLADQPAYHADIVLNQNLHAPSLRYPCAPSVRLLLGPKYALLRREFLRWRNWKRQIEPDARRILVTLGGSDLDNVTMTVVRALERCSLKNLEVAILAGAANPHLPELRDWVKARSAHYRLIVCAEDVAPIMAWADFAISAAGSTCWELCFMGLPAAVLTWADNQVLLAQSMALCGAAVNLGPSSDLTAERIVSTITNDLVPLRCRQAMSGAGRQLVDGGGAGRVVGELLALSDSRPAIPPPSIGLR